MAEDLEAVAELIYKALECPVCQGLACQIRCCCYYGHTVCDTCYRVLETNEWPTCPKCWAPMLKTRVMLTAVETSLTGIRKIVKTTCSNRAHGCRELVAVHDVNEHEASCAYATNAPKCDVDVKLSKCSVPTFQWVGETTQINDHLTSVNCPFRQ